MARSIKKGPFVDGHLMKKVEAAQAGDNGDCHDEQRRLCSGSYRAFEKRRIHS